MAKLTSLHPIMWTEDLEASMEFYISTLGFSCKNTSDDYQWAILSRDGIEIMLAKPNAHIHFSKPVFTGSFYFNTDDVEPLWNGLKDKAEICYEIETFEWGMREFAIYDNNGYILQFGEEVNQN